MSTIQELVTAQLEGKRDIAYRLTSFVKLAKPKRTKTAIDTRLADVQRYWDECRQRHHAISNLADDACRATLDYYVKEMYNEIADTVDATRESLLEYLAEIQPQTVFNFDPLAASAPTSEPRVSVVKLPTINLPHFGGNLAEWTSFKDLFISLVATRTDINNSQRLHYLKSSLQGEAARLLANLPITEANYARAWEKLTKEYDQQRAIVYALFQQLVDVPRASSGSVRELKCLLNVARDVYSALITLSRPIEKWDDLFVFLIVSKLDQDMRRKWELSLGDVNLMPNCAQLESFLSMEIGALGSAEAANPVSNSRVGKGKTEHVRAHQVAASRPSRPATPNVKPAPRMNTPIACVCCGEAHFTYQCGAFLRLSIPQRIELLQKEHRCLNCFSSGHIAKNCNSKYRCRMCQQHHHSLLHSQSNSKTVLGVAVKSSAGSSAPLPVESLSQDPASSSNLSHTRLCQTILPTATVLLSNPSGRVVRTRALLDQGSQSSFVSRALVQALKPRVDPVLVRVSGIGATPVGDARQVATVCIRAMSGNSPSETISALVLPKLSSYVPPPVPVSANLTHVAHLPLADAQPFSREPIELIIGADYYGRFLRDGVVQGTGNLPSAQCTMFGWILSGRLTDASREGLESSSNHLSLDGGEEPLSTELQRFWEIEEVPAVSPSTPLEDMCESQFAETHSRLLDGRYQVRLPFKNATPIAIGDTARTALRIFLANEVRLSRKPELGIPYADFLKEYEQLGHMERVPVEERLQSSAVFLPHHPVVKETSSTTRVRVVFNASCASSNGSALNDFLLIGPKLQSDLFAIILRWRSCKFVYTADLEKMFRQIMVHPSDRDYQRIFWRAGPEEEVQEYRLRTVTYGTASAPFLANRVIRQLVSDEGAKFPLAADVLRENIYVDDVMFGHDDPARLIETRNQLCTLLRAGGFRPYKWAANDPGLLSDLPPSDVSLPNSKTLGDETTLKVLGVIWDPVRDAFSFQVQMTAVVLTKRSFLSLISRIFDPHGWVAPFLIVAKVLMQKLWLHKVGWDEPVPTELTNPLSSFQTQLSALNRVVIPRWTGQSGASSFLELHGYADASTSAYAAVVYLRVGSESGLAKTTLLYAKTKVAPVKMLSVPRLELCAAVLLVRALEFVRRSMVLSQVPAFCWTDSSVVLSWLESPASRWKVFVAHRVSKIQYSLPSAIWGHVPTAENPADCASRGITAEALLTHPLWWSGPAWLTQPPSAWPQKTIRDLGEIDLEQRTNVSGHIGALEDPQNEWDLPERYSSWAKLLRVTAYVMRFVNRIKNSPSIPAGCLSASEVEAARSFWCRSVQLRHFGCVTKENINSNLRRLLSLSPFVDAEGLLRVGGRLTNARLSFDAKHPLLIPACRVAELLVHQAHLATLHGGLRVALHFLRQKFWVINARSLMKRCISRCVACTRHRAQGASQLLGSLPEPRVTPSRPFTHTGVDYAGPFQVRSSKGRGIKSHKAYLVIFVCLSVRAVHLELADDYTTAGFLAAFDRFTARRGIPAALYSDNGTNFVGADRELARNLASVLRDRDLQSRFANSSIEWHFIPPAAPHFGGLWEAGVKSVKFHLRRIVGSFTPTYEEFATLLCKIECVLNSRPIGPLHDDVDSLEALTPGHFLVGSHLQIVPRPSLLDVAENRLTRWQFIFRSTEAFWKVWAADYLNSLQQRGKWRTRQPNIVVGDLVLLKSHNLPPAKWELGRVIRCFPGSDGLVRVVSVKTKSSELKRPVTQLVVLPVQAKYS